MGVPLRWGGGTLTETHPRNLVFAILRRSALRVAPAFGLSQMKLKSIFVFNLLLIGAITGFSQTQVTLNTTPSRGMGQPQLFPEAGSPNRVEGREFFNPQGVALDTSGATPAVYVADLLNNRVLAWKNAATFSNGATADL